MSQSKSLKREVDRKKKWHTKKKWKENLTFFLPGFVNAKPVCLICNEVIAVCKKYNIQQQEGKENESLIRAKPVDRFIIHGLTMEEAGRGVQTFCREQVNMHSFFCVVAAVYSRQ